MDMVCVLLSLLWASGDLAVCPDKSSLSITAPKTMEALSGSCLMIPCSFSTTDGNKEHFDNSKQIYGLWRRHDPFSGTTVYNSSKTDNIYQMNITGNMSQNNCTTLMFNLHTTYTDTYYFRFENGAFKASACHDPVNIRVKDAPGSPTVNISGDLREDVSVTITCSASTPCPHFPPKLTWNLQPEPDNHTEENTDGSFTTKIQETITLSDQHDGLTINCSASYPVTEGIKTAETRVTLNVSYAPKDTSASISPSAEVSAGSWVKLKCSSRARPPVSRFTWFQISSDGATAVSEEAFYTFNATGGGVYYCVASNGLGNQTSPQFHLTVGGTEKLLPFGAVVGGIIGVIVLLCVVVVTWKLKSKNQSPQTQAPTGEESKTEDETIHYGEINFSSRRPEQSRDSPEQQQDTVYTQVRVSERGNQLRQTANVQDDLYAQIN